MICFINILIFVYFDFAFSLFYFNFYFRFKFEFIFLVGKIFILLIKFKKSKIQKMTSLVVSKTSSNPTIPTYQRSGITKNITRATTNP